MSNYFLFSLSVYSFWSIWVITDRTSRYPVNQNVLKFIADVLFHIFMIYFLAAGSRTFLILGFLSVLLNIALGTLIEIFRPELSRSRSPFRAVMQNYWSYVAIDAFVILTSYGINLAGR